MFLVRCFFCLKFSKSQKMKFFLVFEVIKIWKICAYKLQKGCFFASKTSSRLFGLITHKVIFQPPSLGHSVEPGVCLKKTLNLLPSLKLTFLAPENRQTPKRKRESLPTIHDFRWRLLLVSGSVMFVWIPWMRFPRTFFYFRPHLAYRMKRS